MAISFSFISAGNIYRWKQETKRSRDMEQLLQVGVISSTHGIRGEVKVFPTTDDPDRFRKLKQVILDTGREQKSLEIEGVKFFKQFADSEI